MTGPTPDGLRVALELGLELGLQRHRREQPGASDDELAELAAAW